MKSRLVFALVACATVAAHAQQPPAFEVATVKQNRSGSDNASVRGAPGGRVTVTNNTLWNLVRNSYRLQSFQIVGGPEWITTDRWDIVAKGEGDPPQEQLVEMVKTLLADRFKLRLHQETREMPIYALVLARPDGRLGPDLHASTTNCAAIMEAARANGGRPPAPAGGGPLCGTRTTVGNVQTNATTMADLARTLANAAGRSIVDKTGLTGNYDLTLKWTPEPPPGATGAPPVGQETISLFTAIQEQLGLKLEAQRGPVDVLVIDSAQRPAED